MAAPTLEELLELYSRNELAAAMARRFSLQDGDDVAEAIVRCAQLHNSGQLDLLRLVEDGTLQALPGPSFFMAMHFFCKVLPELKATPARVMAVVDALVQHGGDDLAANQPNAAFREWCSKDPSRSHEVIAASDAGDPMAMRHLTFALEGAGDVTGARRIALMFEGERALSAVTALGRIVDLDLASVTETIETLAQVLDRDGTDLVRSNVLYAFMSVLSRDAALWGPLSTALLERLLEGAGELTLHQGARVLWAHPKALRPEIVVAITAALRGVNPANRGTIEELDLGVRALLETGYEEEALQLVTHLASSNQGLELSAFSSFMQTLVDGAPERLSMAAARWLRGGDRNLCDGLAEAMRQLGRDEVELTLRAEDIGDDPSLQIFICRKAIGYFFLQPRLAASVLVSVLRHCRDDVAEKIQDLLMDCLLVNYGGVRAYLERIGADDPAKPRVDAALAGNDAYLAALRAIPEIKELRPSEHDRRIERIRRHDAMAAAHKEAQKNSVLLSLIKRSVILYGNRTLSFIADGHKALKPIETDLNRLEVSFEMPRMLFVDPIGLDFKLRVFRNERIAE